MKKFKSILLIFTVLTISSIGLTKVLEVPQVHQEESEWCWAAVSQSILEYYGESYNQEQIAQFGTEGVNTWNWLWGSTSNPTRRGIDLILDNFAEISSTPYDRDIPLNDLEYNINDDKPVIIRWGWDSGGGHFVVARGIESNMVHIMDPWYGPSINTYNWVKNGSTHSWTHTLELATRPSILNITPTELHFSAEMNTNNTLSKKLQITNSGDRSFYWFANTDVPWINVKPITGDAPVDININVDPTDIVIGTHEASITIMALGAQNSPQIIPITLVVKECLIGLDNDSDFDGIDLAIAANNVFDNLNEFELIASQFGSTECEVLK